MPRAAPGETARRVVRRNLPGCYLLPDLNWDRYLVRCSTWLGTEKLLRSALRGLNRLFYFTQDLFGFVGRRGRLGEVESSVGDCRPPPPGNPRQPPSPSTAFAWGGWWQKNPVLHWTGFLPLTENRQTTRGLCNPLWRHYSYINSQISLNLKEINFVQYFKENCSYFSCIVKSPVLKFSVLHSHMYGLWVVEPPSIAMTDVLVT
jgi:hypothetical protein